MDVIKAILAVFTCYAFIGIVYWWGYREGKRSTNNNLMPPMNSTEWTDKIAEWFQGRPNKEWAYYADWAELNELIKKAMKDATRKR